MPQPKLRTGPWIWPEGVKIDAAARLRDCPDPEGCIVDLDEPPYDGEPGLVVIRAKDRHRWVVSQEAVEVKGVGYGWRLGVIGCAVARAPSRTWTDLVILFRRLKGSSFTTLCIGVTMTVSNRTCASLSEAITHLHHPEISRLFIRYGCAEDDPGSHRTRGARAAALIRTLGGGRDRSEDEDKALLDLVEYYLRGRTEWELENSAPVLQLIGELALDGLEFFNGNLVPATNEMVPPGKVRGLLEAELEAHNLPVALRHYREALETFVRGNLPAAGGCIGSFLENLILEAAARLTGSSSGRPRSDLDNLRNASNINDGEWNLLRACWAGVQEAGRHYAIPREETITSAKMLLTGRGPVEGWSRGIRRHS